MRVVTQHANIAGIWITVSEETLSDRSHVYDVHIIDGRDSLTKIVFPAVSENAAVECADTIAAAIRKAAP